eukprot:CAMPEP_0174830184 /NCGR_PEP_ID=MMETSP1114-20130205/2384_1 /TAXON_ID=312471 /ORGANISM="Neobodo designis, Strain CCAP 1951/1" /LENGTH=230 /DNA_ID=CAMNT_0016063971 /DNA_START=39 /DNA_END=727 /DNA_ORIENTATION=-
MATVRWETPPEWAEHAFHETKAVNATLEQEDAMVRLADEYSAIAGFLSLLDVGLSTDTDTTLREAPPSAAWYQHALPWAGVGSDGYRPPRDQHRALMILHHLSNDLNAVALDLETRLAVHSARKQREAAPEAGRPHDRAPRMPIGTSAAEDARLCGPDLAAKVEEMRGAVTYWAKERRTLQERVEEAELELAKLEEAADATTDSASVDDTSRPVVFRQLRNERVQVPTPT